MENFERVADEILSYIKDKKRLMTNILLCKGKEARFILCGSSGSGKTIILKSMKMNWQCHDA